MTSGICHNCGKINDFSDLPLFTRLDCKFCNTELIVPLIYGEYQFDEILEEHIFFKKYKGINIRTDKTHAVTILNKKFDGFRECLNICRKEARDIQHILEHPGIVPLIEYGEFENTFFIVEPYLNSYKLSEYNPETLGEFESESVFNAFKAIGAILKEAHHKGFVHHNICPENIIIDHEGNVKIQNFFISRVEYKYFFETKLGFNSSEYYISPEKAEKFQEEEKGDVFSLGVMLYYMLSGQYPFTGKDKNEIIYKRIKRNTPSSDILSKIPYTQQISVNNLRNDISPEYSELIDSMLMPYPVQRPNAAAFVTKLNIIEASLEKQKKMRFYSTINENLKNYEEKVSPELKKALKNHELTLHYQPIVNIKTSKIVGLEAFLRWITPIGTIPPSTFLPEAEKNELIHELGSWAIEEACSQFSKWREMGFTNLFITVNISPSQLTKAGFENRFLEILRKYNIDYKVIEFEISHPVPSEASEVSPEKYTEFVKFFNSRVSLSEITTKYASIKKQLSNLKFNSLKIDSEYIRDLKKAKKQLETFNSIIAFANFLSVPTIAEKVETKKQLQFLSKIGCTLAQGYYLYHPLPSDEITKLLQKKN